MPSPGPSQLTVLRRAFVDVCRGYSSCVHQDSHVYVRHLSHREHVLYDALQADYIAEARARGAFTEEERLADVIKRGVWSQAKEDDIAFQRDAIIRLEEGKRQLANPSMIESLERQIAGEYDKLNAIYSDRMTHIGVTAEAYAHQRLNDHYIINNLFKDAALTQPLFTETTFEDFSDVEVREISDMYNRVSEPCLDSSLRRLAVQDFFIQYYAMCGDNLFTFYGRAVVDLTFYQIRLGNMARYFKSLLEQTDMSKLPRNLRHDPDEIERHFTATKNAGSMQAEGRVPTNLSKQDIERLGLKDQMAVLPKRNLSGAEFMNHLVKTSKQTG